MQLFHAEALILADAGTVWDIIMDQGNYQVWDFGITGISGQVGHGQTIRISTGNGGRRPFRLRVHQVPGQVSGTRQSLAGYVEAVKFRAELLSFHLEGEIFPGTTLTPAAAVPAATQAAPQLAH